MLKIKLMQINKVKLTVWRKQKDEPSAAVYDGKWLLESAVVVCERTLKRVTVGGSQK